MANSKLSKQDLWEREQALKATKAALELQAKVVARIKGLVPEAEFLSLKADLEHANDLAFEAGRRAALAK